MDRLRAMAFCLIVAMLLVPLPVASGEPVEDGEALYGPIIVDEAYEEDGSVHWFAYSYVVWHWDDDGVLQRVCEGAARYSACFEYIIMDLGRPLMTDVLVDSDGNVYEAGDHVFINIVGDEYATHGIAVKLYADTVLNLYIPADEDEDSLDELWRVPVVAGALAVLGVTLHRRRRRV